VTAKDEISALDRRHLWHPFTQEQTAPPPIAIREARGAVLTAEDGRQYLDLISSWWVTLHGHAHPAIAAAIACQAERLEQVIFAGFTHRPAVELAHRLAGLLPGGLDRVFFSDDGSTAVEVALKLSHQYWRNRGRARPRFLAFAGGYHGDTVGAMSAGARSDFFDAFSDLLFPVDALPYPETWQGDKAVEEKEAAALAALETYLDKHGAETAAMIMEPLIQGASGMRMCRPEFLRAVAKRLRKSEVLLIFDEVMTGFGRTGALFASLKAKVTPDLICLSKGLTGGFLPLSVTVCRNHIYEAFLDESFAKAFAHGHSFTANPLGCAAALASLDLLEGEETQRRWGEIETLHRRRLTALADHPKIAHARVTGTVAALDFKSDESGYCAAIGLRLKNFFLQRGLLLRPLGNVVYLLAPYCITNAQLNTAYDAIEMAADEIA
jgi:adenosylmethionine-8-amino-7-oxononanoate aminotransferase